MGRCVGRRPLLVHPSRFIGEVDGVGGEGRVEGVLGGNGIGLGEAGKACGIVAPGEVIELDLVEPLGKGAVVDAELGEREDLLLLALEAVEARHGVISAARLKLKPAPAAAIIVN
jgi:hypothetical protein